MTFTLENYHSHQKSTKTEVFQRKSLLIRTLIMNMRSQLPATRMLWLSCVIGNTIHSQWCAFGEIHSDDLSGNSPRIILLKLKKNRNYFYMEFCWYFDNINFQNAFWSTCCATQSVAVAISLPITKTLFVSPYRCHLCPNFFDMEKSIISNGISGFFVMFHSKMGHLFQILFHFF